MAVNITVSTATQGAALTVAGSVSGTSDHRKLAHRDAADQHPIGAITGLESELPDALTNIDIESIVNSFV